MQIERLEKKHKNFDIRAIMHTEVPPEILKLTSANMRGGTTRGEDEAQIVYNAFSHVPVAKKSLVFLKLVEAVEEFKKSLNT